MPRGFDPPPSYYEPPEPKPLPRCPVCNAETDTYYIGYWGNIIGCDECVTTADATDYEEEER